MMFKFIPLVAICLSVAGTSIHAQFRDSAEASNRENEFRDKLWLMGSLSGSLYLNRLDTAYIQEFGSWGYSLKFGGIWHNRVLQFDFHGETEHVFFVEHRYDYALLYGISSRNETIIDNVMAGISILDYLRRGTQLIPPSTPNAGDGTYQKLTGTVIGLAVSAEFYLTPCPYWGLFGMGLYGCLNKGESYVVLEFSILELNLPLNMR